MRLVDVDDTYSIEEKHLLDKDSADGTITAFHSTGNLGCIGTKTLLERCCDQGSEELTRQTESQTSLLGC